MAGRDKGEYFTICAYEKSDRQNHGDYNGTYKGGDRFTNWVEPYFTISQHHDGNPLLWSNT